MLHSADSMNQPGMYPGWYWKDYFICLWIFP